MLAIKLYILNINFYYKSIFNLINYDINHIDIFSAIDQIKNVRTGFTLQISQMASRELNK
jgi:hypothetical protein